MRDVYGMPTVYGEETKSEFGFDYFFGRGKWITGLGILALLVILVVAALGKLRVG